MIKVSFSMKKRTPVMISALLAGVAIAGLLSAAIETPQSEDEFLHDHLGTVSDARALKWHTSNFDLPSQDRFKISQIIKKSERSKPCKPAVKSCDIIVRVNRRLTVDHVNADYRVANIKETGLRVDLQTLQGNSDIAIKSIFDETRNLRFYQTQSGWVQNAADSVEVVLPVFNNRGEKFRETFGQRLTGLNYYPASASWADFWKDFPLEEIQTDLEKARALNVNALRIFLNHDYFDSALTRDEALAKLNVFLDLCEDKDIKVLVTLFDLRPNYTLSNWAADIDHIDYIFSDIANHKAMLAVDLKNQADLDFESWGVGIVEAWLTVMARHIQTQFSEIPVTTGWSKAQNAKRLNEVFDVVTYHEYQNPENFAARLSTVKSAVGGKPVMITELGSTIWHPPFIENLGEKAQANRLEAQLNQAEESAGVFVWTLNDFDHVGSEVVGRLPWRKVQQKHYGLTRPDGSLRPAATILKSFAEKNLSHSTQN